MEKDSEWTVEYAETIQTTTQILTCQEIETTCFGREKSSEDLSTAWLGQAPMFTTWSETRRAGNGRSGKRSYYCLLTGRCR